MYHRISYTHDECSPRFPGNPANDVKPVLTFAAGDGCNAAQVCLFNHNGTHVDLPNHYHEHGRRLVDYDLAEFVFERPVLVHVSVGTGQAIRAAMLQPFGDAILGKDLLLLSTGFWAYRASPDYTNNPYLTLDAAQFLRGMKGLRGLGIDFLSIANARFRALGDEVHRNLLGTSPDGKPILIVEDLDLSAEAIISRFRRVFAMPLFVDGVDGMPCTVFGEYEA